MEFKADLSRQHCVSEKEVRDSSERCGLIAGCFKDTKGLCGLCNMTF